MEVEEVGFDEYCALVRKPFHVFASGQFNEINKDKVEKLHFLILKDSKPRLAICGGVKDREFRSPFSAPFGGFVFLEEEQKFQFIDSALDVFQTWAEANLLSKIRLTLPPSMYNETFVTRQVNVLFRKGYSVTAVDVNHFFATDKFNDNYVPSMWHNARKNFRASLQSNLTFVQVNTEQEKETAYEVIARNRAARGFPLRMTWQQVQQTTRVVEADFFLIKDIGGNAVAAAIVFHVSAGIVQVIYWGDLPEYSNLRTMNFLTYHVFQHYNNTGIRIVDIGPSTENSVPNFGLCDFKESIGCDISTKFSFSKVL